MESAALQVCPELPITIKTNGSGCQGRTSLAPQGGVPLLRPFVSKRKPTFLAVLLVPMVVMGTLLAGIIGYASVFSSQQLVNEATERLRTEANARIEDHLHAFFQAPLVVSQVIHDAIVNGRLDPDHQETTQAHFYETIQLFPMITSISFGFPSGGLINAGREGLDQRLYAIGTADQQAGPFFKRAVNSSGDLGELLQRVDHFDATERPWYQRALEHDGPVWSEPYLLATSQDMALAVSRPVYDSAGVLVGVINVDLFLGHLEAFIRELELSQGQHSLILDEQGRLLASSKREPAENVSAERMNAELGSAADSDHPAMEAAVRAWQQQKGALGADPLAQVAFDYDHLGQRYLGHTSPYALGNGLYWQIMTTIPYEQVLGAMDARRAWTWAMIGLALAAVLAAGFWLTRRIVRPMQTLETWAGTLAAGDGRSEPLAASWIWEVDELGQSLTRMWSQLQITIQGLEQEVRDRHAAEQLLRDNRERYRQLTDDLPAMICEYEPDGTLTYVNGAYCKYHNAAADELLGRNLLEFWPEERREQGRQHFQSLCPSAPTKSSVHHVLRQGKVRWQEWHDRGFFADNGQLLRVQAIGFDITERQQMEDALRQSEERYRSIIAVSNTGAWEYHKQEGYLWGSPEYYSMLGLTIPSNQQDPAANLQDAWSSLIHPDDRGAAVQAFARYLQDAPDSMYENTFRMRHTDGHWVWIWSRGQTLRDELGQPTNLTVGTHIDISQVLTMEQELINEKEQFRTTLLSVGEGVISTDRSQRIAVINDKALTLTGFSRMEAVGQPLAQIFQMQADADDAGLTGRELSDSAEQQEGILITKSGRKVDVEYNTTAIHDQQNTVTGSVLVFRDVTERKERQQEVEFLSYYDPLTGLYNRRFFEEELRRLDVERNLPLSLLMVDVNGLKLINDAFGHTTGDRLLQTTAAALRTACRADDVIARIGGDEFMVLLPNTDRAAVRAVNQRIWDAIQSETIEGVPVSVSWGSSTKVDSQRSLDRMYKDAEDAMYRQKISERTSQRHTSIGLIMKALYEKTPREQEHSQRVGQLCGRLAEVMNLSQSEINELITAGSLHDIGKVAIGDQVLDKPGPLTQSEWTEMQRHPDIGFNILSEVNDYARLANYVLSHHERWDGSGYPNGLAGEAIPLQARIMAVCDAYDAMTSSRPYRAAMDPRAALAQITAGLGTQFDPVVGQHFVDMLQAEPEVL